MRENKLSSSGSEEWIYLKVPDPNTGELIDLKVNLTEWKMLSNWQKETEAGLPFTYIIFPTTIITSKGEKFEISSNMKTWKIIINGNEYELNPEEYKYFYDYLNNNDNTIEEIEQKVKEIIKEQNIQ